MTFHLMFVHVMFSSVRLIIYSLLILSIRNISYFPFRVLVLDLGSDFSVPDLRTHSTFTTIISLYVMRSYIYTNILLWW